MPLGATTEEGVGLGTLAPVRGSDETGRALGSGDEAALLSGTAELSPGGATLGASGGVSGWAARVGSVAGGGVPALPGLPPKLTAASVTRSAAPTARTAQGNERRGA